MDSTWVSSVSFFRTDSRWKSFDKKNGEQPKHLPIIDVFRIQTIVTKSNYAILRLINDLNQPSRNKLIISSQLSHLPSLIRSSISFFFEIQSLTWTLLGFSNIFLNNLMVISGHTCGPLMASATWCQCPSASRIPGNVSMACVECAEVACRYNNRTSSRRPLDCSSKYLQDERREMNAA